MRRLLQSGALGPGQSVSSFLPLRWSNNTIPLSTSCRRTLLPATTQTRQTSCTLFSSSSLISPSPGPPLVDSQKFYVHSTFRNHQGHLLLPDGLDWHVQGTSHPAFVLANENDINSSIETNSGREALDKDSDSTCSTQIGLIQAYNQWAFAKGLAFKSIAHNYNEIESVDAWIPGIQSQDKPMTVEASATVNSHYQVTWNDAIEKRVFKETRHEDVCNLLLEELDSRVDTPPEVWVNGAFVGFLATEGDAHRINEYMKENMVDETKMVFKRSDDMVRVDRYYSGYLTSKVMLWHHILDNLYAMEDPKVVDSDVEIPILVGTAILPDWVRGGRLASRLWIQQDPKTGDLLCLRPLRNDDIATSDRRLEIENSDENKWITGKIKTELRRLRYLATLDHPFDAKKDSITQHGESSTLLSQAEKNRARQHRNNRRKFFTL